VISRTIQGELITNVDEDFEVDTPLDKMANASSGDEKKRRKRGKKVVGAGEPAQESREGTTGSATVARKGNGEVKGGAAVTADSDAGRSAEPPGVGSSTRQQNLETSEFLFHLLNWRREISVLTRFRMKVKSRRSARLRSIQSQRKS
jgi:hypothetical protein